MYVFLLTIWLILPTFVFAGPMRPRNSLGLTTLDSQTLNAIGYEPVDPRFSVLPQLSLVSLDEDEWLVTAVEVMGYISSVSLSTLLKSSTYNDPDPGLRVVSVVIQPAKSEGRVAARYIVWGFYSAIKGMITINRFRIAQFTLRWEQLTVGVIKIGRRQSSLYVPEGNYTGTPQQHSSFSQSNFLVARSPDNTNKNLSLPLTSSGRGIRITYFGRDLPKHDIILTIVETLLLVASRTPLARVSEAVIVSPSPHTVQLHVIPYATTSSQPDMTVENVALAVKKIPGMLLEAGRWSEVHFDIVVGGVEVAHGLLVRGIAKTGSGLNGTSIG